MTKQAKLEREEAIERLREILKPGDTVYCVLRHVSRSGMQRLISLHSIPKAGELYWLSGLASKVLGNRLDTKHGKDGLIIGGCGMDMGFALVYDLSETLYGHGNPAGYQCIGREARCHSNDHSNPGPNRNRYGKRVTHHDGYALRHRWI